MKHESRKLLSIVLTSLMIFSVVAAFGAGTAAAQTVANSGGPADVPGGESSTTQQIAAAGNVGITGLDGSDPDQHAVKIDLGELASAGADLSDVEVSSSGASTGSVDITNVNNGEVQLVVSDTSNTVVIDDLQLDGIDTSNLNAAQNLEYTIRVDNSNAGDFSDSAFTTDAIQKTSAFNVASIQVVNTDNGEDVTETSLEAALEEADRDGDGDITINDGDTVEVRLPDGTYSPGAQNTLDSNVNIELVATSGQPTIVNQGASSTLDVGGDDTSLTVEGIQFDQNENANSALKLDDQSGDLTVSNSVFNNSNGNSLSYIVTDEDATSVEITDSLFEDPDATLSSTSTTAIEIKNTGSSGTSNDVTLTDNVFNETDIGVDLSNAPGNLNSITVEDNEFFKNDIHVNGDSGGNPDLDTIFSSNTFGKYVITRTSAGEIHNNNNYAIYGDFAEVNRIDIANTDSLTTILSEGEHGDPAQPSSGTIPIDSDDIEITKANGATTEDVVVAVDTGGLVDIGDVDGTTISGITFDDGDTGQTIVDATDGDAQLSLVIENNRFINIGGSTPVVDLGDVEPATVSGNTFEAKGESSDYDAIRINNIGADQTGGSVTVDITDNDILNTSVSGAAINVNNADGNPQTISVNIENNELLLTGDGTGIDIGALDNGRSGEDTQITISDNSIEGDEVGSVTGIEAGASDDGSDSDTTIDITDNDIVDLNADTSAIGIDLDALDDDTDDNGDETLTLTVSGNSLDANSQHIKYTGNDITPDGETFSQDNTFDTFVFDTANTDDSLSDQSDSVIYGTIEAGISQGAGSVTQVRPGTYVESGISTSTSKTIRATGSADETVITSEESTFFFELNGDAKIDGFTFAPEEDSSNADVEIASGGAVVANSTFEGPGVDNRIGIAVESADSDVQVSNNVVSGYSVGVDMTGASATIADSTVIDNDVGVRVDTSGGADVVRNAITSNNVGVDVTDNGNTAIINFNNIVDNEDAGAEFADVDELDMALANWFGTEEGPDVSEDSPADIVVDNTDDIASTQTRPWLTGPVDTLPDSGLVLVTDPTNPAADADPGADDDSTDLGNGANWVVASLDDDEASNIAAEDIVLTVQEGPDNLVNINEFTGTDGDGTAGSITAADPIKIASDADGDGPGNNEFDQSVVPEDNTAGEYTVRVLDTGDSADADSATQEFSAPVDGVEMTSSVDELVADDDTEASITLQLVDENGNAVPRADVSTSFAISGGSDAGITRIEEDSSTDTDGQATLNVTADTAGETFTVTGIDTDNDNSADITVDTVNVSTANFNVSIDSAPSQITQNESYTVTASITNDGGASGTQDVTYELSPDAGVSPLDDSEEVTLDAGESTTVDFEFSADQTEGVETGSYDHTVASDNDEATQATEVEEAGTASASVTFNDQSVQNGTEEVTVDSADFTRADGSAGDYVVVVHVVSDEFDGGLDNSISAPVGASGNLSNGAENITVDLNSSAAFEDDDALDSITENVTLRAMLHTTANSSAFGTRLGNAIDGIEPGDETDDANITVTEDAQPQNPVIGDSPAPAADLNGDGKLEDVNGDGEADFDDAIVLAFNVDAASENVDAFDFDEDGDVDFDDAIALAFE